MKVDVALDDDVTIFGIEFHRTTDTTALLAGNDSGAGAAEKVQRTSDGNIDLIPAKFF